MVLKRSLVVSTYRSFRKHKEEELKKLAKENSILREEIAHWRNKYRCAYIRLSENDDDY